MMGHHSWLSPTRLTRALDEGVDPFQNRAILGHTHKLPLDVTRASSHLGIPMPSHMMIRLCGGACYATPHSQNTGSSAVPAYFVQAGKQGHPWRLLQPPLWTIFYNGQQLAPYAH